MDMTEPRSPRKRSIIDPRFQLGLALRVVSVFCCYLVLFGLIALFSPLRTLLSDSASDAAVVAAGDHLSFLVDGFLLPLVLALVCMALHAILLLHRVAGPAYRFGKALEAMRDRDISTDVRLRKGDYLTEIADRMNGATAVLREDFAQIRDGLERLAEIAQREWGGVPETRRLANAVYERVERLKETTDRWRVLSSEDVEAALAPADAGNRSVATPST
jgi:hypothetical protein